MTVAPSTSVAPRPDPIPPFERTDLHEIKQQLHDALGEEGLPYWKALKAYLLGQVGRNELQALVRGWLKPKSSELQTLSTVTLTAQFTCITSSSLPCCTMHPRRSSGKGHPLRLICVSDGGEVWMHWTLTRIQRSSSPGTGYATGLWAWVDESVIVSGNPRTKRMMRRVAVMAKLLGQIGEVRPGRRESGPSISRVSLLLRLELTGDPQHPPLAQTSHLIPSSHQLGLRLSQVGNPYGLHVSPEAMREIGEFMGVGLNAHLGDMLHSISHLTGHDRPGQDTMRIPLGVKNTNVIERPEPPVPTPDLHTLQYLFNLTPGLQPQASPTLYKLASSLTIGDDELHRSASVKDHASRHASLAPQLVTPSQAHGHLPSSQQPTSPVKATSLAGQNKVDAVIQTLVDTQLLKPDKAGRDGAEEPKREKKHNLHWKYEDPAIILKDLLG